MNRNQFQSAPPAVTYRWVDFHALAMVVILALGLFATAFVSRGLIMSPAASDATQSEIIMIGDNRFKIQREWLLGSARSGDINRISLRIPVSSLIATDLADPDALVSLVFTTSDKSLSPSERVRMLYARFLSSEATPASGGLIRRQFRDGTPYEGETLFLSPPEGRAFAARCPTAPSPDLPVTCYAEIRHAGFDIQIQLARRDLALWEKIVARVRELPSQGN
jgi:hypothetical protein